MDEYEIDYAERAIARWWSECRVIVDKQKWLRNNLCCLHIISFIIAVAFCFLFKNASISHIGAAIILFSTLLSGVSLLYAQKYIQSTAAKYEFIKRSEISLIELEVETDNKPCIKKVNDKYENRIIETEVYNKIIFKNIIIWELFMVSAGTLLWGFADLICKASLRSFFY